MKNTIVEINSTENNPRAFEKVFFVSSGFGSIDYAVQVMKTVQEFITDETVLAAVPTLCEDLLDAYENTLLIDAVAEALEPPAGKDTLSPEALQYLASNDYAASVYGINSEILNEDYSLKEEALSPEDLAVMEDSVAALERKFLHAENLWRQIMGFSNYVDDEDEYPEDDWEPEDYEDYKDHEDYDDDYYDDEDDTEYVARYRFVYDEEEDQWLAYTYSDERDEWIRTPEHDSINEDEDDSPEEDTSNRWW